MSDGKIVAWSAGVGGVSSALAGLLLARATTPLSKNPWFILCVVIAVVSFAVLLLAGPHAAWVWWRKRREPRPPPPTVRAEFTGLRDGSKVSFSQQVTGLVSGIPNGFDTWLIVQPILAPDYWPQDDALHPDPLSQFRAVAYFGQSTTQNSGEEFILMIVSASQDASQRFREFVGTGSMQHGMQSLPSGSRVLKQITVKRL